MYKRSLYFGSERFWPKSATPTTAYYGVLFDYREQPITLDGKKRRAVHCSCCSFEHMLGGLNTWVCVHVGPPELSAKN